MQLMQDNNSPGLVLVFVHLGNLLQLLQLKKMLSMSRVRAGRWLPWRPKQESSRKSSNTRGSVAQLPEQKSKRGRYMARGKEKERDLHRVSRFA